ncbi:sigma intracellular receptor 2 isoform X1 [Columba livia]|uniref:sigma intracellular receptor 2 isoform X1 n=1 Tax=Columba livia TaxID=8932 RepID=UPI0031BAA27D
MNGSYEALFSSRRVLEEAHRLKESGRTPESGRSAPPPPMPRSSRPPGLAQPRRGGGRGPRLVGGAVSGGGRGPGQWAGRTLAVGGARRGHGGGSALAGAAVRAVLPLARPGDAADRPAAAAARRGLPARRGCKWIRTPAIIYSTHVATTLFPILAHILFHDFSKSEHSGPQTPRERLTLLSIYLPYLLVPLLILYTMLRSPHYNQADKRKRK